MNKKTKMLLAGVVSIIVVTAGIIVMSEIHARSKNDNSSPPWSLADFNRGTLTSGNFSLYIVGDGNAVLNHGNSSQLAYFNFLPSSNKYTLVYDSATYSRSGRSALEILNFSTIDLKVDYTMNHGNLTESFSLVNMQSNVQSVGMSYYVNVGTLTNVTVSSGNPHNPDNSTLYPSTHGFTETYNFNGANLYMASFRYGVNYTLNWYSMEGVITSDALTFNSNFYNSTSLDLGFSGFSIPPYSNLSLGEVTVSF